MERERRSGEEKENRGGRRKNSWKKNLLIVILAVVVLVLALGVGAYAFFKNGYYDKSNYVKNTGYTVNKNIQRETYVDEEGNTQTETEVTLDKEMESEMVSKHAKVLEKLADEINRPTGTYNLLLIGVDRRDTSWSGNSDVMMLLTLNHDKKTIYMTSFLRDLYADIPEVGVRKLNASCAYGGAELCVETIRSNYGVEIDNYAMVDFYAMIDIVDALGGIDLEVSEDEVRVANGYILDMCNSRKVDYGPHELVGSGMLHLDGYQAVGYARNRYTGNTYDFGRTERQRKVLIAIFDKVKNGSISSLNDAAQSVLPYVTHDIDESTVLSLIAEIPKCLSYEIVEQHIPYDNMYHSEKEILIPNDMEETITKLRETIY